MGIFPSISIRIWLINEGLATTNGKIIGKCGKATNIQETHGVSNGDGIESQLCKICVPEPFFLSGLDQSTNQHRDMPHMATI